MDYRKYRSTACESIPYEYSMTHKYLTNNAVQLFWYVLADEHEVEVNKFETEEAAIRFIKQCHNNGVGVITVFYGREMCLEKIELLCPKD